MRIGHVLFLIVGVVAIVVMAAALYDYAPDDGEDSTDVILLMGQSNAAYRESTADASTASPVPEPGTAFYYGTSTRPANFNNYAHECGIWPISDVNGARIGDKWPSIAAEYMDATGHNVVMAQIAQGGESIVRFSPTEPGRLWVASQRMVADVMEAMRENGMRIGSVHVVWIQGEADVDMSADEYEERLMSIGETIFNGGLGCDVEAPIWISLTRGSGGSVEAQKEIVSDKPGLFKMASTVASTFSGDLMADALHYSQKGNNILGGEIGEAVGTGSVEASKGTDAVWRFIGLGVLVMLVFTTVAIFNRD